MKRKGFVKIGSSKLWKEDLSYLLRLQTKYSGATIQIKPLRQCFSMAVFVFV